jgi:hypothetical protein
MPADPLAKNPADPPGYRSGVNVVSSVVRDQLRREGSEERSYVSLASTTGALVKVNTPLRTSILDRMALIEQVQRLTATNVNDY